jgi:hypothetical protein
MPSRVELGLRTAGFFPLAFSLVDRVGCSLGGPFQNINLFLKAMAMATKNGYLSLATA